MAEFKKLSFLNRQTVLVDFEVVLLKKNFECNFSIDTTFKEILLNIEESCLAVEDSFYDFKSAIIMDSKSKKYCEPSMKLKDTNCRRGSKYYIY